MSAPSTLRAEPHSTTSARATALVLAVAAATVIWHWIAARYGFHRDELATLYDARHLAWGFVAYPPVTPFFGRLSLILFRTSLPGFRFFASVAGAAAMILTALMARQLGGRRGAQWLALVAAMPACIGVGALMQYVAFDYLCWALAAYFVLKLLTSDDPRWWVAIGAAIGLGMMTKYTMGFLTLGIVAGVLFTPARRFLKSKWLWIGAALSILILLPNVIWQAQHQFVSRDFLNAIHARDVRIGRTSDFLPDQLKYTLLAVPLWLAGLWFFLFSPDGKRFRMLGLMYVVPLALFLFARGRGYYLLPAYSWLYAGGAVWGERRLGKLRPGLANAVRVVAYAALALDIALIAAVTTPLGPVGSRWWNYASSQNGDLNEETGWPELVQEVARIRDSLPPSERAQSGILAANYGEAGSIDLYGPNYNLPPVISGVNSFWYRRYPEPPPQTLIVLGFGQGFRDALFNSCELAGHTPNPYNLRNEETGDHPDIYVCRGFKQNWPDFWSHFHRYG